MLSFADNEIKFSSEKLLRTTLQLQNIFCFLKEFFKSPALFYFYAGKLLLRIIYHVRLDGFDNIPEEGPAIIISNHVSYLDGFIIGGASKRWVRFVIDENIYNIPFIKHFMRYNGAIPIAPRKDSVKQALKKISIALENGEVICIFPEGSMTYTGNMMRFRFGIEWILKDNKVPVIPVAICGLWGSILSRKNRKSKLRFIPKKFRRKVTVLCGAAISHEEASVSSLQRAIMLLKSSTSHK